jgi:membrane protein
MKTAGPGTEETSHPPRQLPARLASLSHRLMSHWTGRTLLRSATDIIRLELFDRSMTIAAQLFTSVFPILIMSAVWLGKGTDNRIADAINMPAAARTVLLDGLGDNGIGTFGILGTVAVLLSATSLSRALTRSLAVIWRLPRPRSRVFAAWRGLAAVLSLAICLVAVRAFARLAEGMPLTSAWTALLAMLADSAVALFVPWLLLGGQVAPHRLVPGAVVFALVMLGVRPAGAAYLPGALETSSQRYGPIGVAFTYLGWLYVVAFCFLAAAVVGRVLAEDEGRLGRLIRDRRPPGLAGR